VSWVFVALLAAAIAVLVAAEWPRVSARFGAGSRARRQRARRKSQLKVVRTDIDDFEQSVQRDLDRLPTIEEQEPHRR
jgi:Flp pilus assembly protein TadB